MNDLEAFRERYRSILEQADLPDYEITEIESASVHIRLASGATVEISLQSLHEMHAAMRVLFDPADRQRAILQFMAAGEDVTVRRRGAGPAHRIEVF